MNTPPRLEDEIKALIVQRLGLEVVSAHIGDNDDLLTKWNVDSAMIDIPFAIEEKYSIELSDVDISIAAFRTVKGIADIVRTKKRIPLSPPVPGYIKALDGSPLYCVHHPAAPVANPQRRYHPVVLIPSLFEERKSAYAALRRMAERLAAAGHAAMRFDFRGSGESGGDPAKRRVQHLAEDVAVVRKTLARLSGARDSVLLGLRFGATVALQETLRAGGEAVIALAPIVNGSSQVRLWKMRSKIRSELTQESAGGAGAAASAPVQSNVLDFDGYEVSNAFFEDVAKINLLKDLAPLSCPALVTQLSHRTEPVAETLELQKTLGARARVSSLRIEPFWDKVDDVSTVSIEDAVLKFLESI